MALHSWSNCPRPERLTLASLCLTLSMTLSGCAALDGRPIFERQPQPEAGAARPYLNLLREYLAEPPERRNALRAQLRDAAESGDRAAKLQYAFALSLEEEDVAALAQARQHFETLLVEPEPLPVALDSLVRVQLRQVIGRLDRLAEIRELRLDGESCDAEQRACHAALAASRDELRTLREKLEALTRIEQTVNEPHEPRGESDDDTRANEAPPETAEPETAEPEEDEQR